MLVAPESSVTKSGAQINVNVAMSIVVTPATKSIGKGRRTMKKEVDGNPALRGVESPVWTCPNCLTEKFDSQRKLIQHALPCKRGELNAEDSIN